MTTITLTNARTDNPMTFIVNENIKWVLEEKKEDLTVIYDETGDEEGWRVKESVEEILEKLEKAGLMKRNQ